jgi:hypothetical protein
MIVLKKLLRGMLMAPLALLLLFEEWGWEPLARALARLARLPLWAWLEGRIRGLPPWAALLVFGLPMLGLLPVKLLALYLLGGGQKLLGLAVLIGAKLLGTAVAARLFQLTQPTLMHYRWFAFAYPKWKAWKDGLEAWIRASAVWQGARRIKAQARAWWAAFKAGLGKT